MRWATTIWRDTMMEYAYGQLGTYKDAATAFGVSGPTVATRIKLRQKLRRQSYAKLVAFKAEYCADEIRSIKRKYDAMHTAYQAVAKEPLAAWIDVLLAHYRAAHAEAERLGAY